MGLQEIYCQKVYSSISTLKLLLPVCSYCGLYQASNGASRTIYKIAKWSVFLLFAGPSILIAVKGTGAKNVIDVIEKSIYGEHRSTQFRTFLSSFIALHNYKLIVGSEKGYKVTL